MKRNYSTFYFKYLIDHAVDKKPAHSTYLLFPSFKFMLSVKGHDKKVWIISLFNSVSFTKTILVVVVVVV